MQHVATINAEIAALSKPIAKVEQRSSHSASDFNKVMRERQSEYQHASQNKRPQQNDARDHDSRRDSVGVSASNAKSARKHDDITNRNEQDRANNDKNLKRSTDNTANNSNINRKERTEVVESGNTSTSLEKQDPLPESNDVVPRTDNQTAERHDEPNTQANDKNIVEINDDVAITNEEFDWIAYVDKIKSLNDLTHNAEPSILEENIKPIDELADIITLFDSGNSKALDNSDLTQHINNEKTDKEFLTVSVSEQQLSLLVEAGNDSSPKTDEAFADIVQQLLTKFERSKTSDKPEEHVDDGIVDNIDLSIKAVEEHTISDIAQTAVASTEHVDQSQKLPLSSIEQAEEVNTSQSSNTLDSDLFKVIMNQASPNETIDNDDTLTAISQIGPEELVSQTQTNIAEKTGKAEQNVSLTVTAPDTPKIVKTLALLPDDVSNSAIDNIAERLAQAVPELRQEAKGVEFIAAMQAGVKEFKEQLKQGREPGIDLKSLVSESLAKVDVVLPSQLEGKVAANINQFSAALGLASSVQQSSSQQQAVTGLVSDIQQHKEINQQQVESNKSVQQQQSTQDKSFNMMKSEGQQQLADKVRYMVTNKNMSADIRLDPPDLGGMTIKLNMSGDSASVNFTVQSQQARDVLEQAIPKLKDMLEEQGIQLGQSSVQQDSQNQQGEFADKNGDKATQGTSLNEESVNTDEVITEQRIVGSQLGGIDYYA